MARSKKHFILLVSVILLLVTNVSCHHKKPQPQSNYCDSGMCETTKEAKDYFLFNTGSWWVYEEENTHVRDSVYVTESVNDSASPDFDCKLYSVHENYYYHYFPIISSGSGCSSDGYSANKCIYIRRSKGNFGDYLGEENCFFIQAIKGTQVATTNTAYPNDFITVSEVYQSYNLGLFQFQKTIKIHEGHSIVEHNNETNHYFSKWVGLIRKELIDSNEVWNLVSYHIEP